MLVAGVACRVRDISREQQHNNLRWGELPSGDAYFSLLTTWRAQIACLNWTKSKQEQTHPVSAGSNCGEHGSGRWPTNTVVYRTLAGSAAGKVFERCFGKKKEHIHAADYLLNNNFPVVKVFFHI